MAEEQTLQDRMLYLFNKNENVHFNSLQEAVQSGYEKEVLCFLLLYLDDIIKGDL